MTLLRSFNHDSLETTAPKLKSLMSRVAELSGRGQQILAESSYDTAERAAMAKLRDLEPRLKSARQFSKKYAGLESALKSEIKGLK